MIPIDSYTDHKLLKHFYNGLLQQLALVLFCCVDFVAFCDDLLCQLVKTCKIKIKGLEIGPLYKKLQTLCHSLQVTVILIMSLYIFVVSFVVHCTNVNLICTEEMVIVLTVLAGLTVKCRYVVHLFQK